MTKVSYEEYIKFLREGRHPSLRFGQSFCNHFSITDPDLYYCTDSKKAQQIILDKYLQ